MLKIAEKQKLLDDDVDLRFETVEYNHNAALDLERKRHRVEESKFGFVSQNDLGKHFQLPIGSVMMGRLLRVSKICKISKNRTTEPYTKFITTKKIAKSGITQSGHIFHQYNPDGCIKEIENWLGKAGYLNKFYSIEDQKDLYVFINELFEEYVENK